MKRLRLTTSIAATVLALAFASASHAQSEAAAKKWIDGEFQPSTLSKEEQMKEMQWFMNAAKPFKGMEINVLSETIPTHEYESKTLTKAFEEITGIKVNHQLLGEGEVVQAVQANNPKVKALEYNIQEAESRVGLSNANFLPKVNVELSSSYEDQVESSETYEQGNQAMLRMRWNLFNGGADVADRKAAIARKFQSVNSKEDQLVQVIEEATATWAKLQAYKEQVIDFGDATGNSQKTLDSYMKQFTVGQRTLLDVLDARNELFQSSGLLVTAKVNEVIAAERLLALSGTLNQSLQMDEQLYTASSK